MEELEQEQLQQLKKQLLQIRTELEKQLSNNKEAAGIVELDQSVIGRVTRMDAIQQQSMAVSTRNKARQRLKKVNLAISNFANGDYGYCRQCDEAIALLRLQAQPESSLCLSCQSKADNS